MNILDNNLDNNLGGFERADLVDDHGVGAFWDLQIEERPRMPKQLKLTAMPLYC